LDWHKKTGNLLSCSADRAAIVWIPDANKELMPQMCVTKEKKSNIDASWNHRGDKFCIGTSSGYCLQATYNEQFGFWVCSDVKPRHKASVVCVRYDPGSGRVCASVSLDGTVQIKTCYDPIIDGADTNAVGPYKDIVSEKEEFLFKFNPGAWVNFFSFSPSGAAFCFGSKLFAEN
jgi:WD40 repeat protein